MKAALDINYGKSAPFSLGVEEEFMLLHEESYELVSRFDEVAEEASHERRIKAELLQSVIEVATHVAGSVGEAIEDARGLRATLRDAAAERGAVTAGAGTHPFSRWERGPRVGRRGDRRLQLPAHLVAGAARISSGARSRRCSR